MEKGWKKQLVLKSGFSLIEMSVAMVILGMIIASVFVVINRALETVGDWQTKIEAFAIARDNMEKLLAQPSLSDKLEYGTSQTNPDINWETKVESFYEPVSNKMWMRAVCTAEYKDSSGEDQKIELEHWLTSLNSQQIKQILEQQQRERLYAEEIAGQNTGGEELPLEGENQNQDFEGEAELNSRQSRANNLGPPPPGYDSWDDVPAKDLFKMLKNGAGK